MKVKKINNAIMPKYQNPFDSGMDLHACIDEPMFLDPGCTVMVPTGLAIEIKAGLEGQIRPRSSMGARGVIIPNSPGTIDSGYRGEIGVLLHNLTNVTYEIEPGDRIAQLVIMPVMQVEIEEVTELSSTERGTGGFGSTGK